MMQSGIFQKQAQLKPSAMATVAERRFGDAEALVETGDNARANGAAYLAGFVIEILLKARLVEKYAAIARKRQHQVAEPDREVWSLSWRGHDMAAILDRMPELEAALEKKSQRAGKRYVTDLKVLCATWTVHARYSPMTILMDEARQLLERVRSLKEVLK